MPPFNPDYPSFREFPKWIGNVLVSDAAEEREIRTAAAAEVEAAAERMIRVMAEVEAPEAAPPEPEPARPPASAMAGTSLISTSASVRPPSPARERMRRMRERHRDGKRAIMLEVSAMQIAALVQAGVLDPAMQHDAAEVALGIGRMLDQRVTPASPRS